MSQNPEFFETDLKFNEYVTNRKPNMSQNKKKFESYLVKSDFILVFDKEFPPHIKCDLDIKLTKFHFKKVLD